MDNYGFCVGTIEGLKGPGEFKVLDYGCGAGKIVSGLREKGVEAFGCDVFYKGSGVTRQGLPTKLRSFIREMKGGKIPYPSGTFDCVVSNQVLEHVEDLDKVLSEMRRVLKKGGLLLSLFPDKGVWREEHMGLPFLHWFPRGSKARTLYAAAFRGLGLGYNKENKGILQWAKDAGTWLDRWTHYRDKEEISRSFREKFTDLRPLEAQWVLQRLGRRSFLAAWIPSPFRRLLVNKLCGLVFTCRKGT